MHSTKFILSLALCRRHTRSLASESLVEPNRCWQSDPTDMEIEGKSLWWPNDLSPSTTADPYPLPISSVVGLPSRRQPKIALFCPLFASLDIIHFCIIHFPFLLVYGKTPSWCRQRTEKENDKNVHLHTNTCTRSHTLTPVLATVHSTKNWWRKSPTLMVNMAKRMWVELSSQITQQIQFIWDNFLGFFFSKSLSVRARGQPNRPGITIRCTVYSRCHLGHTVRLQKPYLYSGRAQDRELLLQADCDAKGSGQT